jgi:hypothetical protein
MQFNVDQTANMRSASGRAEILPKGDLNAAGNSTSTGSRGIRAAEPTVVDGGAFGCRAWASFGTA